MKMYLRIFLVAIIFSPLLPGVSYAENNLNTDSTVYYVTNRVSIVTSEETQFGNSIDPDHLLKYGKLTRDNNLTELKQFPNLDSVFADIPKTKNILVFVHGAGKTFDGAMERAFQTHDLYDVAIIVFTYPTHDPVLKAGDDFRKAVENADSSVEDFKQFLLECARLINIDYKDNSTRNVSLLFHSLGNYLLERCIEGDIQELLYENFERRPFENILMVAAAVDSRDHASWMSDLAIQKNLLVISNKHDITLKGAKLFTSLDVQLGEKVIGEHVIWAEYYDLKKVLGFTFNRAPSHSYFYGRVPKENKAVWIFFNDAFSGNDPLNDERIALTFNNRKCVYYLNEIK